MIAIFPADVHVGVAPDYLEYVLPFACSAHYQNEARLRLSLMIAPESVTLAAVAQGQLDLLITGCNGFEQEDLGCERVYHDRMFIVAAQNHPLVGRGELMLSDLVRQQWALASEEMERKLCSMFRECGLPPPNVALRSTSSPLRVTKVATSRLLGLHSVATLLSLAEARAWLSILPVKDFEWNRPVLAIYRSARSVSPAARRLIEDMKAIGIKQPV